MPANPETSLLEFPSTTLPHVCLAFTLVEDLDASDDVRALCSGFLQTHEKDERGLKEAVRWSEFRRKEEGRKKLLAFRLSQLNS